jgi:hypothetical protein
MRRRQPEALVCRDLHDPLGCVDELVRAVSVFRNVVSAGYSWASVQIEMPTLASYCFKMPCHKGILRRNGGTATPPFWEILR